MKIWCVSLRGMINGQQVEMQSIKDSKEAANRLVQRKVNGCTCYAEPDGSVLAIDKVEYVPGKKQVRPFDNPDLKTKFHISVAEIDKDIVHDTKMGEGYFVFDDKYSIYIKEKKSFIEALLVPRTNKRKKYRLARYRTEDAQTPEKTFYFVLEKALRLANNL